MSDIDFDELDKAVNSLMGGVPKEEPTKIDETTTITIPSTIKQDAKPSFAALDTAIATAGQPAVTPQEPVKAPSVQPEPVVAVSVPAEVTPVSRVTLPPRRKSSGRFMDVVHPSSDMKGTSAASQPSQLKKPTRRGVTIGRADHLPATRSLDQATSLGAASRTVAEPVTTTMPARKTGADPAKTVSPTDFNLHDDTFDITNLFDEGTDISSWGSETTGQSTAKPASDPLQASHELDTDSNQRDDSDIDEDELKPQESPFLSDAKVEKRPLGGSPTDATHDEASLSAVTALANDTTYGHAAEYAATPAIEPQLQPEYRTDLMSLETGGDSKSTVKATQSPAELNTNVGGTASALPAQASSGGATSIQQQYHEEESTGDLSNGSIFDTSSYHQPIKPVDRQKPGWLWIIWIILLMLAGGGAAALLYFSGII